MPQGTWGMPLALECAQRSLEAHPLAAGLLLSSRSQRSQSYPRYLPPPPPQWQTQASKLSKGCPVMPRQPVITNGEAPSASAGAAGVKENFPPFPARVLLHENGSVSSQNLP